MEQKMLLRYLLVIAYPQVLHSMARTRQSEYSSLCNAAQLQSRSVACHFNHVAVIMVWTSSMACKCHHSDTSEALDSESTASSGA